MKTIINEIVRKFKKEIEEFFEKDEVQIERAEEFFVPRVSQVVTEMLAAYYEKSDEALLSDKAGRKEAGLVVERCTKETGTSSVLFETMYFFAGRSIQKPSWKIRIIC